MWDSYHFGKVFLPHGLLKPLGPLCRWQIVNMASTPLFLYKQKIAWNCGLSVLTVQVHKMMYKFVKTCNKGSSALAWVEDCSKYGLSVLSLTVQAHKRNDKLVKKIKIYTQTSCKGSFVLSFLSISQNVRWFKVSELSIEIQAVTESYHHGYCITMLRP